MNSSEIVIALISASVPATIAIIGAVIKHRSDRAEKAAEARLSAPDAAIARVIKTAEFADQQFGKLQEQFERLQAALELSEQKYEALEAKRELLQEQYDELEIKYEQLQKDHQKLMIETADLRAEVARLNKENKRLKRELDAKS